MKYFLVYSPPQSRWSSGWPSSWTTWLICRCKKVKEADVNLWKRRTFGLVLDVWLMCLPHHFIFTASSEEMFFEVKVHEDTAHPPRVNTVTERQAEEHFWSPDKERRDESVRSQNAILKKSVHKTPWKQERRHVGERYLYGTGCTTIPGETSESWKAIPKSISLTFRPLLLASMMLSGLTSACKILRWLRASSAMNIYRWDENFKFPPQQR